MLETPALIARFAGDRLADIAPASDMIFLSGEGSSRIFPAKRAISQGLMAGSPLQVITEGATQAREYDLTGYHVYIASNSGRTAEAVHLIRHLQQLGTAAGITGIAANPGTPVVTEAETHYVLTCGPEEAVAATKSVMEQALVYETVLRQSTGADPLNTTALAERVERVLTQPVSAEITAALAKAPRIFFAGRNDGAAEELALKTNEITRQASAFLEGTFAVHGIEEVMTPEDVVVLVEPFADQVVTFDRVLRQGVGLTVIAISAEQTPFPTLSIPKGEDGAPYVHLAAGWNLLVEVGLARGIDLDRPVRARKIGNQI